jgi:uncharacterized protein YjiS (DUF1127 family)
MTTIDTTLPVVRAAHRPQLLPLAKRALDGLSALIVRLLEWQERARQRRQLLALSDGALKDFGASRADAEGESSKPAWQP